MSERRSRRLLGRGIAVVVLAGAVIAAAAHLSGRQDPVDDLPRRMYEYPSP